MSINGGPYLSAYQIIVEDFRRATQFVEPADANLGTYGHRFYEILLRACTEFESVCKDALVVNGSTKSPRDMNVNDYKTLEGTLKLESLEIGVSTWQPAPAYVRPFQGWSRNQPPLGWYRAYNEVKHNRNTEFSKASLENVRLAIAGLFGLMEAVKIIDGTKLLGVSEQNAKGGTARERVFTGHIFTIIKLLL
jgi:hypothetical protein